MKEKDEKKEVKKYKKRNTVIFICFISVLLAGALLYEFFRYDTYDVINTYERTDEDGTQYASFANDIVKYSSDGAFYTEEDGTLIWNISYEYSNPDIDLSKEYVLLYDKRGRGVELLNKKGHVCNLDTNMSIRQAAVSDTGVVAILMEEDDVSYLQLFTSDGTKVAEGHIYPQNHGYPIAIDISSDGKLLMVSCLDINDKDMTSHIIFYNFGSVGQNESDNIVSSYTYKDEVIPEVAFMEGDTSIAFGSKGQYFYTHSEKPKEDRFLESEGEIRSLSHDDSYYLTVTDNTDENDNRPYLLQVYNKKGRRVGHRVFDIECNTIKFIGSHEIAMINDQDIHLYTKIGVNRFNGTMNGSVYGMIPRGNGIYVAILRNKTQRIRLK